MKIIKNYKLVILMIGSLIFSGTAFSIDDNLVKSLLRDIKQAQKRLELSEKKIAISSSKLTKKINQKQNEVIELRKKTAVNRRLVDEKTLDLKSVEARLKEWKSQNSYQTNLLVNFVQQLNTTDVEIREVGENPSVGVKKLTQYLELQNTLLKPRWNEEKIILKNGEIKTAKTFSLGPIDWFLSLDKNRAGLLERKSNSLPVVSINFSEKQSIQLKRFFDTGYGELNFDPTLNQYNQILQQQESILKHLSSGGFWVFPILLFALIATIIGILKLIELSRLPKLEPLLVERLEKIITQSSVDFGIAFKSFSENIIGAQKKLLTIVTNIQDVDIRDDKLLAFLIEHRKKLESRVGAIAVIASVSPLLGLLGTVSGMIETFKMMTVFGAGDPAAVSGGISKALITTELGLVVAIPALILHAYLSKKIGNYNSQLESTAIRLSKIEFQQNLAKGI